MVPGHGKPMVPGHGKPMVPGHGKPWSASPMTMVETIFNLGQFDSHQEPWCHLTKTWSSMVFNGCMTMNYHGSILYSMVVHGHLTIIFAWELHDNHENYHDKSKTRTRQIQRIAW